MAFAPNVNAPMSASSIGLSKRGNAMWCVECRAKNAYQLVVAGSDRCPVHSFGRPNGAAAATSA
jgi:hypothetical protein